MLSSDENADMDRSLDAMEAESVESPRAKPSSSWSFMTPKPVVDGFGPMDQENRLPPVAKKQSAGERPWRSAFATITNQAYVKKQVKDVNWIKASDVHELTEKAKRLSIHAVTDDCQTQEEMEEDEIYMKTMIRADPEEQASKDPLITPDFDVLMSEVMDEP